MGVWHGERNRHTKCLWEGQIYWGRKHLPAALKATDPRTRWRNTCGSLIFVGSWLLMIPRTPCPQERLCYWTGGLGTLEGLIGGVITRDHREKDSLSVGGSWPLFFCAWSPSTPPLTSQRWTGLCWARRNVWAMGGACLGAPASSSPTWPSCPSSFSLGLTPWPWLWRNSNSAAISPPRWVSPAGSQEQHPECFLKQAQHSETALRASVLLPRLQTWVTCPRPTWRKESLFPHSFRAGDGGK